MISGWGWWEAAVASFPGCGAVAQGLDVPHGTPFLGPLLMGLSPWDEESERPRVVPT